MWLLSDPPSLPSEAAALRCSGSPQMAGACCAARRRWLPACAERGRSGRSPRFGSGLQWLRYMLSVLCCFNGLCCMLSDIALHLSKGSTCASALQISAPWLCMSRCHAPASWTVSLDEAWQGRPRYCRLLSPARLPCSTAAASSSAYNSTADGRAHHAASGAALTSQPWAAAVIATMRGGPC